MRLSVVVGFYNTYTHISRPSPSHLSQSLPLTQSHTHKTQEITIEALPTKEGVYVGVVLFRPDSPVIKAIKTKEDARTFFAGSFPQFLDIIKEQDLERFATGPIFKLPSFTYCGPQLHYGGKMVLLGDTIHSVKPYFGLGLNRCVCVCWRGGGGKREEGFV